MLAHPPHPLGPDLGGEHRAEPVDPPPDRLVADVDATLERQVAPFRVVVRLIGMTKSTALLVAICLAAPPFAHAAIAPGAKVDAAFGNTVLTVDPDGRSRKIWLQPDGTWTGLSRRGLELAGRWTAQGDRICLKQSKPRLPGRMCEKFPTDFGASVEAKDPTGRPIQLKLVRGHVTD